jgi:hypothetical protein
MLKRLPYLLTLLAGLLICGAFIAAKAPAAATQYDFISVVQVDDHLEISSTSAKFEDVKFKKDTRGLDNNFTALLSKVSELQGQGYELVGNSVFGLGSNYAARNYMLLRRPKQ